jgi:hypothetical protein
MLIARRFLGVCLMTPNPYDLAAELARPVVRGYLTRTEADVALLLATPDTDTYRVARHILDLNIERLGARQIRAETRMKRHLRPLIALRKPRNVLLAEAHDINGSEGFPFTEEQVADVAAVAVHQAVRARRFGHV